MKIRKLFAAALLSLALSGPAMAGNHSDLNIFSAEGDFDDVAAFVEDAIISRGLGVDYRGKIGDMLKRTGEAVGSSKAIYKDAQFFQFCSAVLSRNMMEADPRNIGYCPYVVAVYELASKPGTVYVSYRRPGMGDTPGSKKALAAVDKLLEGISREATE